MQLKFLQSLISPQEYENKIISLAWSPNNLKLAVATTDRQVLLFDENGERRDKFPTKPSNPEAGKKSYLIKSIAFSPCSTKIAVAQTDCIVYVYKIGENWNDKKAICNKFPQPLPITCMIWLPSGLIICGLTDGKVRGLHVKSNKSQSLYTSDSFVVSLAAGPNGTGFLSGHADGNIIRYYINTQEYQALSDSEPQGRIVTHTEAPYALAWPHGHIWAAGCDNMVIIYNGVGKIVKRFDYTDKDEKEFTVACCSPSGQTVAVGSYDRIRIYSWIPRKNSWEEAQPKEIENMYTVTALAWKKDGSRFVCGTLLGAVLLFESVLKRSVWKEKFEITYVGPSQVLIKPLVSDERGVVIRTRSGNEIEDVKIMGKDQYIVARTETTLLIGDLQRNLLSEVSWNSSGRHEKFYFDNPTVCLVFNAGELSLIEYGEDTILHSVRTEFANPHLISVRLNERTQSFDNKKLAYLLDLKTICLIDLVSGVTIGQITHDSKIDWLELSETSHKLLFRDKKQRLMLVNTVSGNKVCIMSGVSFVQWVTGSDVAVAQSGNNLAVWYNIDLPDNPTMIPVRGDIIDIVRENGRTEAIGQDGRHSTVVYELDEALVEFGTAVHDNDYGRAVLYLESIGDRPEAEAMWHNLASIAMATQNLLLAERCYAALGDVATTCYLNETRRIGAEFAKEHGLEPNQCADVWARMAILNGDLRAAESIYLEQGDMEKALNMYKELHRWDDALRLAEQRGYNKFEELREEYMSVLMRTGQEDKVGQLLEQQGDYDKAIALYLKSSHPNRAAALMLHKLDLLSDESLVATVIKNLLRNEYFEPAAELYEKLDKPELALECYRKGKVWSKAVELARHVSPDKVVELEEEWGDALTENKQTDAAINHYIEAGKTKKALDAAVEAKQWKKAVHIVQVINDPHSVKKYYEILGQHFAGVKDYKTAEKLFLAIENYKAAIDMYNEVELWEKAHALASKYLEETEVSEMYVKQAEQLEGQGKFRDAEKLYLSVGEADMAIAMYKRTEQYDSMVRLVERYHPDLVQTTHLHLGQQLETQGKHRAAEVHYLSAGEWKAAMNMYRAVGMWEEAYRVAKQNGGQAAASQVAFLWARTLPIDSGIKLLTKYGLLEACVDYSCETYQFEFAFQLCKNLPVKIADVHYKYAMALEDDGKFSEAETEFIAAGKPKEAVLMYIHNFDWIDALRVAENRVPEAVPEVLQAQANQCFTEQQYSEYETLLLRAQMPELIVQKYKDSGMWVDALRVCKDYLPTMLPTLQAEYARSEHSKTSVADPETLIARANEWAIAGQHSNAIECLLQVNMRNADLNTVKQALTRAADLVNKFLVDEQAIAAVRILGPRLVELDEHAVAAQLYLGADMVREAVDSLAAGGDWVRARKVARELEPAYEAYVESRYKERLKKEGDVEQLADIDIIGALDLLAEQGQWSRCLEKAKTHGGPVLNKYVALYAGQLLREGLTTEALDLFYLHGTPALKQNFNIYIRITTDFFAMTGMNTQDSYDKWARLRKNLGLENTGDIETDIKDRFRTLLLITHYFALRSACRQVQSLDTIVVKLSTAMLRYTDTIPADKAFYEAGIDLRSNGRESEAYVFLNHYLDICEAIEDGQNNLVDHSDLSQTDFPSSFPLPADIYLKDDMKTHDDIREWVLAISMDQKVDQALPLDDRKLYESALTHAETPCIVTGYPISKQPVTFQSSTFLANKDSWSKLVIAAKMSPHSNISDCIEFIEKWCGKANYMMN